jgi:hypothetical protein
VQHGLAHDHLSFGHRDSEDPREMVRERYRDVQGAPGALA